MARESRSAATWWRVPRSEHAAVGLGLLVSLLLAAVPATTTSAWYGLDPSWQLGLNAAGPAGLRFGPDIVFTYGPWGFIDYPYPLDRPQYAVALVASTCTVAVLWLATYAGVRRLVSGWAAVLTATVTVPLAAGAADVSTLAVAAAAMVVVLDLLTDPDDTTGRLPVGCVALGVATCSGLLVQVKLSSGIAMLVVAVLAACAQRTWRRSLLTLGASLVCASVSFLACWLLIGQDLGDIPAWLPGSRELISGYAEAKQLETPGHLVGYLVAACLVGFIVLTTVRGSVSLDRVRGVVLVALVVALLVITLKGAFTRHDRIHEPTFFVMTTALIIALGPLAGRPRITLVALGTSVVMLVPGQHHLDLDETPQRWQAALQVVLVPGSVDARSTLRKEEGRAAYLLPQSLVDLIGQHPVAVDPVETALAIDHDLHWHPMPVIQSYAAYTTYLDELNAEAARNAPADQHVLRADDASIDGRNPRWETPGYLLTLACEYDAVHREAGWTLLRHARPRCGVPTSAESLRVAAGQLVRVPDPAPGDIVVARFEPDRPGLLPGVLRGVLAAGFKDHRTFRISVDDQVFRMPVRLAGQPAMMAHPDLAGGAFLPFAYESVAYNRPGTVTFATISTTG